MNIFVIHSTSDEKAVTAHIDELKRRIYNVNALILKNGRCFWKAGAAKKIKKAQMVVFFVGENSHKSPYIEWEINKAVKYGKAIYVIKLKEDNICHKALLKRNEFSDEEYRYDKEVSFEELIDVIKGYEGGDYCVVNQMNDEADKYALLEQYKLFLQTSEDLVSRRQNVNSFYISINSALVALFGTIFTFDIISKYRLIIGIMFSLVGIVLSVSWIKMLISYGNLNSSKMKIISCIEKSLPASLYDSEWKALSDKLNKKKYVSFTDAEKRIPVIFILIYIAVVIFLFITL